MNVHTLRRLLALAPLCMAVGILLGSVPSAAGTSVLTGPATSLGPAPLGPSTATAYSGSLPSAGTQLVTIQARSATDIYNRFDALKPAYTGTPYASTPSWAAPYAAGSLASGFASDGIRTLNFFRYVAGLPDDVVLDSAEQNRGMHGAVLLAASTFSHNPPKPSDMTQAFYDLGLSSTSRSNIGSGHQTLESFQLACIDDDSTGNIPMVGHRRWILNPPMAKTGMGFANNRSTTYAFDSSRASSVDYDYIAWPPAGPMPVQLFGSSVPWSVTLNPARYDWTSDPHTVTLRRTRDGAAWTFTAADTNTGGEYFTFNTNGYGVANCFIFRPTPSSVTYRPGDVFEVTLSGGIYLQGTSTPATVRYTTTFIPLGRPDAYEDDDSVGSAKPLAYGTAAVHTIEYSTDEDWHSFAAEADTSYGFSVTSTAADGSITVAIYDGAAKLYEKTVSGSSTVNWSAPTTKTYFVKVTGRASSRLAVPAYTIKCGEPGSDPGVPVSVANVAGANRYQTAVEASKKAFPAGAPTVVIATGANWPDALGGASLAGALDGPILLTAPSYLPNEVAAEIARLGATKAVILGGTGSVSRAVETTLRAKLGNANVERIAGANRYDTARLVAHRTVSILGSAYSGRAFVATGANFPDALGASPLAAAKGWPIYLVSPASGVDAAVTSALRSDGVKNVVVLGSTSAVSSRVQSDLTAKAGCGTVRLGGANRYATALAVAEYGVSAAGLRYDGMAVATGENFPDALAGGVLQGSSSSVLLLTPSASLNGDVAARLSSVAGTVSEVRFLGGTSAVSNAVRSRVLDLLF